MHLGALLPCQSCQPALHYLPCLITKAHYRPHIETPLSDTIVECHLYPGLAGMVLLHRSADARQSSFGDFSRYHSQMTTPRTDEQIAERYRSEKMA